jgi:hypothetical protein
VVSVPLFTNDINEAIVAYSNLEFRTQSAELRANVLQATFDKLREQISISAQLASTLTQQTTDQEAANAQLRTQQAGQVSPDIPLAGFISAIGMSAALGEATMPDRSIPLVETTVTAYHTPDGGLRFYQPEFGGPGGFGTTSFSLVKTPPPTGASAPRNLYLVVEYAQAVYDDPFWAKFVTSATPPVQPAKQIVAEAAKLLANAAAWDFPFLVQEIALIASLETNLASLLSGPQAPAQLSAFFSSVKALEQLAQALDPSVKPVPVAGDLLAITAALDATVRIADNIRTASSSG